jgi:hypothetical protein
VADYSNPQLTNRARDRIAHLEANTAQRNGGGQRTGRTNPPAQAPQARAGQNGRRKRNRKLRRRRGPSVAAAGLGLDVGVDRGGGRKRAAAGGGKRGARGGGICEGLANLPDWEGCFRESVAFGWDSESTMSKTAVSGDMSWGTI